MPDHTLVCCHHHHAGPPDLRQAQAPENTVTYVVALAQFIILAVIFNKGMPHRSPLFTNVGLLLALLAQAGWVLYTLYRSVRELEEGGAVHACSLVVVGGVRVYFQHLYGWHTNKAASRLRVGVLLVGFHAPVCVPFRRYARQLAECPGARFSALQLHVVLLAPLHLAVTIGSTSKSRKWWTRASCPTACAHSS